MRALGNVRWLSLFCLIGLLCVSGCEDGTDGPTGEGAEEADEVVETSLSDDLSEDQLFCLDKVGTENLCGVCTCTSCVVELMACQSDPGCQELKSCRLQTGCYGSACAKEENCGHLYEKYPGGLLSMPAQLSDEFMSCVHYHCNQPCVIGANGLSVKALNRGITS